MPGTGIDHVIAFWRPAVDAEELAALARHGEPGQTPSRGITMWSADAPAMHHRVVREGEEFALFAAVHPIDAVPPSAEVVAEIFDASGQHRSYILHFPAEHAVVLPFVPDTAIQAFWREEHVPSAHRTVLPRPVLSLYYAVKPLLPAVLRSGLRRTMAHRADTHEHFLAWPADRSLDLLQRLLLQVLLLALERTEVEFVWFWPDGHPWAVTLTHDVETAGGVAHASRIADVERERGLRSSFNLVPLDYEVPDTLLSELREGGFEIGIHGDTHDGMLFSKESTFVERVGTINERGRALGAVGFRSPATYRNPDWMRLLEFEYDSSYTDTALYEPQPGGCASLFPYFIGEMVELPMTLPQDHTLFGLLSQTDATTWLDKLRVIRESNGMACVLSHPDPGPGYIGQPENEAHYRTLLDAIVSSDAWLPLPRDLARWWRERSTLAYTESGADGRVSLGKAVLDPSGRLTVLPPGV